MSAVEKNEATHEEEEQENLDSSSSDDDGGDLILLAKYSNVKLRGDTGNAQVAAQQQRQRQQQRKQAEQEKARAEKKKEIHNQNKAEQEKQRLTKTEKRLAFTMEALRVADSHVPGSEPVPVHTEPEISTEAAVPKSGDAKQLLAEGYRLSREKRCREAISVLKQAWQVAADKNNLAVALSSCTLLGNEHLALEQTRDAIDCFHKAIQLARQVGVTEEQRQSLIFALQNAYKNVGDSESAKEVTIMYGPSYFASEAVPKLQSEDKPKELTSELSKAVDDALEQALLKKDLQPIKTLVASFAKTPYIAAVLNHAHPHTGVTCLHVAAGRNDVDLVQTALGVGANLGAKDSSGSTPLLWAARFGGVQVLDQLLANGAKFGEDLSEKEIGSWPPAVKQRVANMVSSS